MVFQEPRLLLWRSVEEKVRLDAPRLDEAKLSALFAVLELNAHRSHFAVNYPSASSGASFVQNRSNIVTTLPT